MGIIPFVCRIFLLFGFVYLIVSLCVFVGTNVCVFGGSFAWIEISTFMSVF